MQDNMPPQMQEPEQQAPQPQDFPIISDASVDDFEAKVIQQSMTKPVILDFWAPWCGPCKQLLPVLEQEVTKAGGKVALVKVNIDDNPQLAQALRVQSVPTVFGFFQGQPVDGFAGAQPPSQVAAFVDKLVKVAAQAQPDAIDIDETLKTAAQALSDNDFMQAQQLYVAVLQQDEKNAAAYAGLVRTLMQAGEVEQAQAMLDNAPDEVAGHDELKAAQKALELAAGAGDSDDITKLRGAIEKKPEDHAGRIDLSKALFANGQKEEAIDELLESIRMDKEWNEGAARIQLLEFFEALGHADPLTIAGRKRLSTVFFS